MRSIPVEIIATERQEHLAFMRWSQTQPMVRDLLIHIPNEYDGGIGGGHLRKRLGVRKGVSDFFLPIPKGSHHGLWMELKRKSKGKPTFEQKDWIERMQKLGYAASFCFGCDEAIDTVKKYMEICTYGKI